jgi:hypothetical protein
MKVPHVIVTVVMLLTGYFFMLRIDLFRKFEREINEQWFHYFLNRQEKAGLSVNNIVTSDDEWCAEAYMETDYATLSDEDFANNNHIRNADMFHPCRKIRNKILLANMLASKYQYLSKRIFVHLSNFH